MFYLLFGPDEFSVHETVARLRQRLAADDPLAELNYTDLDGRALSVPELQVAADALPFMAERRLVVVRHMLARCNRGSGAAGESKQLADRLTDYLPNVSSATRLVFVDGPLDANNPVRRWALRWLESQSEPGERGIVREYKPPSPAALPRWLADRAADRDISIEPAAAAALAEALSRHGRVDLRLAATELDKLAAHAGDRPIVAADVSRLVTPVSLENVFRLVDALGARDGRTATNLLHELLAAGEPPLRLTALITRQFRLLLHTRTMMEAGVAQAEMSSRLGVPPFVATKLLRQCRGFTTASLMGAMHTMRDIDTDIKTGKIEPVLALDLLLAAVCGAGAAGV